MKGVWSTYGGQIFQSSSALKGDPILSQLINRAEDYLLRVGRKNGEHAVLDEVFDVRLTPEDYPAEARGMCLRCQGLLHPDKLNHFLKRREHHGCT